MFLFMKLIGPKSTAQRDIGLLAGALLAAHLEKKITPNHGSRLG